MICKKCGFVLTENDQFCKNCGAVVTAQEEKNNIQQINSSQPSFIQQPMNSQPSLAQQPMNNQPSFIQQPVSNQPSLAQQPMNNYQQNNSNNNQNSWQNDYNSMPDYQQQKPKNKGMFIGIGVAVVVVVVGIIVGLSLFGNNNKYSDNNNSGGNEVSNKTQSTYSVKFKDFTFKIPTNLIYNTNSNALFVGDEADTWQAAIEVVSGSFNQLQTNKNNLISVYQKAGYGASNVNQKNYGGLDFVTLEITRSGQKAILGFTKANSMFIFGTTIYNVDNSFNYNLLPDIAKILSTAEYSTETNSISTFNNVDMDPISDLVK